VTLEQRIARIERIIATMVTALLQAEKEVKRKKR
jgi:hypothetical protein